MRPIFKVNLDLMQLLGVLSVCALLIWKGWAEWAAQRLGKTHRLKFGAVPCRSGEVNRAVADVTHLHQNGFKPRHSIEDSIDLTLDALVAMLDPGKGV